MTHIPERAPIGDLFTGYVLSVQQQQILALSPHTPTDESTEAAAPRILYHGSFVIRYGVRLLGKPHLSVVPALVALDYGEMLTGDAAWEFILKRSNQYPRADVVGFRNDGVDEMLPIKWLDLALPVEPLVYANATENQPIAKPVALIATDAEVDAAMVGGQLAPRLLTHLPRYDSVDAWQT